MYLYKKRLENEKKKEEELKRKKALKSEVRDYSDEESFEQDISDQEQPE